MKTCAAWGLAIVLTAGILGTAQAAPNPEGDFVTQGELAQRLVERLGLWRLLEVRPTNTECFAVLLAAGISPSEEGWQEDEPVTAAVLARILVQALGGDLLVPADKRDDPSAWLDVLRDLLEDMGLIETVEGALSVLSPDEGIRNIIEWFSVSSDELIRQHVSISDARTVIRDVEPDPEPVPPVTPVYPTSGFDDL